MTVAPGIFPIAPDKSTPVNAWTAGGSCPKNTNFVGYCGYYLSKILYFENLTVFKEKNGKPFFSLQKHACEFEDTQKTKVVSAFNVWSIKNN